MKQMTLLSMGAAALILGGVGYLGFGQVLGLGGVDLTRYASVNVDLEASVAPATTCGDVASTIRMVCLMDQLKTGLAPEVLAELQRPYSLDEAKKWSNFPPVGYADRIGPTLGDFTPEQRGLIKLILMDAASLSSNEGYDELVQVLNADDFLAGVSSAAGFSSSNYHIAFLGTPAATGTWQLYFGGHHFALTNTYTDGVLAGATPSFRGVEPFTAFSQNGRENAPMLQEQAAFAAMFAALSPDELARATLAGTYSDIVAGPQKDDAIPTVQEGLRVGDLSEAQQALVLAAIETYVRDINASGADAIMARYKADLPDTFIGLVGSPAVDAATNYVRIDGPSVWIEFSLQTSRTVDGIHPHSVWRDKTTDYGGSKG